jgi:serine/threonine protein phosphatase PrpC
MISYQPNIIRRTHQIELNIHITNFVKLQGVRKLLNDMRECNVYVVPLVSPRVLLDPISEYTAILLKSHLDLPNEPRIAAMYFIPIDCKDNLVTQLQWNASVNISNRLYPNHLHLLNNFYPKLRAEVFGRTFNLRQETVDQILFKNTETKNVKEFNCKMTINHACFGSPQPRKAHFTFSGKGSQDPNSFVFGEDSCTSESIDILNGQARLTLLLVNDGHGGSPGGLEWSARATNCLKEKFLNPEYFSKYIDLYDDELQLFFESKIEECIHSVTKELENESWMIHNWDTAGTTMALSICITFLDGRSKIININLGDSAFMHVDHNKSACINRSHGWETLDDFQEYLNQIPLYVQKYPNCENPTIVIPGWASPNETYYKFYKYENNIATLNHPEILSMIFYLYEHINARSIGGHQVSESRRHVVFRDKDFDGIYNKTNKYRIYAFLQNDIVQYVGHSNNGAYNLGQFRTSFGDIYTTKYLGFLNKPLITVKTINGPFAIMVMSDGVGDMISDPKLRDFLWESLDNNDSVQNVGQKILDYTLKIAHATFGVHHDDISFAIALLQESKN